jgi:murein L,D-transpeptidase YafK
VVTHYLPSRRSIDPAFAGSPFNPAFASRLDELVAQSGATLWVHGHTHRSADYFLGTTRVVCNPRGYHGRDVNPDFKEDLIVEV